MRILPKRIKASFEICKNLLLTHRQWDAFKDGPLDSTGISLPWFTYPAITYLLSMDLKDCDVFEFGSGRSTLFWSKKCKSVNAVEGDRAWHQKISPLINSNAKINLVNGTEEKNYVEPLVSSGKKYDIIVIDGWHRRHCAEICLPFLNDGGFILHDNTEWYPDTRNVLMAYDLLAVDFFGFIPSSTHTGITSFYFSRNFKFKPTSEDVWRPGMVLDNHEGLF